MKRLGALLLILVLPACVSAGTERVETAKSTALAAPSKGATGLDQLTINVELKENVVQSGARTAFRINVRNDSDKTVTDPGCYLAQTSAAIIPKDAPDAELWLQVITDCAGPFEMEPGYENTWTTTLLARTKTGEALMPGEYVAALEMRGVAHRFQLPIEVTE